MAEQDIDLALVPISALRDRTKKYLETSLNELKVIPTDEDEIPRDWRGVAHYTGVSAFSLAQSSNPISDILKLWYNEKISKGETRPSLMDLKDILGRIDRWDVYDDTEEMMLKDADHYYQSLVIQPAVEKTMDPFQHGCLTTEDAERFRDGLPLIKYDAFLLYAEEDIQYASVMIDKLENDFKLRLVVKDRDLLSGVGLEFTAITKLIAERCSSLIVILSPNLLKSEANMFFLTFAQTLSIKQQQKRIIPCKYEPCDLPPEISYLYYLDYQQSLVFGNFWQRIKNSVYASIGAPPVQVSNMIADQNVSTRNRCTITEVKSEEIKSLEAPNLMESTAVVRMSDPTTHYPGNSVESPSKDKWFSKKSASMPEGDSTCQPMKTMDASTSLFDRLKKKKNWNWLKKKKAVALSA